MEPNFSQIIMQLETRVSRTNSKERRRKIFLFFQLQNLPSRFKIYTLIIVQKFNVKFWKVFMQ